MGHKKSRGEGEVVGGGGTGRGRTWGLLGPQGKLPQSNKDESEQCRLWSRAQVRTLAPLANRLNSCSYMTYSKTSAPPHLRSRQ